MGRRLSGAGVSPAQPGQAPLKPVSGGGAAGAVGGGAGGAGAVRGEGGKPPAAARAAPTSLQTLAERVDAYVVVSSVTGKVVVLLIFVCLWYRRVLPGSDVFVATHIGDRFPVALLWYGDL